jgi:hypothetical protein
VEGYVSDEIWDVGQNRGNKKEYFTFLKRLIEIMSLIVADACCCTCTFQVHSVAKSNSSCFVWEHYHLEPHCPLYVKTLLLLVNLFVTASVSGWNE